MSWIYVHFLGYFKIINNSLWFCSTKVTNYIALIPNLSDSRRTWDKNTRNYSTIHHMRLAFPSFCLEHADIFPWRSFLPFIVLSKQLRRASLLLSQNLWRAHKARSSCDTLLTKWRWDILNVPRVKGAPQW